MSKLTKLQRLCDAATPGPWFYDKHGKPESELDSLDDPNVRHGDIWFWDEYNNKPHRIAIAESIWLDQDDGKFIAAARTYMPLLIAVARAADDLLSNDGSKGTLTTLRSALAALEQAK